MSHPEHRQSQRRLGQATSVVHESEVSFVGVVEQQQRLRDLWPRTLMVAKGYSLLIRGEPFGDTVPR